MAGTDGRSAKPANLGDFNFFGVGNGDHEGSVAFSDISFPSHVSDLESFHSDLDISMHSQDSMTSMSPDEHQHDGAIVERQEDNRQENEGELPDLPEQASENVDVLLAALKAATMQESSSDRASIDSNRSANSSNSNVDSSRFISKESFPESVLAEASASWAKEASHSAEESPGEAPSAVLSSEKCQVSAVQPSSDSRLSEKFLAPSKTPDNGHTETFGGEKSGASPWSFSGDSLLFQTPRPGGDTKTLTKNETSSKRCSEAKTKPSSSSTPVEVHESTQSSNRPSISNETFPAQQDRLSDMEISKVAYNPFDESRVDGLNNNTSSKRCSDVKTKPSSSSTPVEKPSVSNDTFPAQKDGMSDMDFSKAVYNPFDGSHGDEGMENGKGFFGDGDGLFGNADIPGEFSFQSGGDAAKRLDEDEKIFEESHRFEDAMVPDNLSFSYYVLPGESRKSVIGVNDPNDKGEVRISFSEFFATKTEELGRLGDGNENRPRPRFSDTRTKKVSPVAMAPRPLYRPSSPEGSERDTSYQPSFTNLEKAQQKQQKSGRTSQSHAKKPVAMATRSSPYGAEAEEEGKEGKKGESGKSKENDMKSSKRKRVQAESRNVDGEGNIRRNSGGLELNNSTLAALKFCNSSEGSKLSEMSSNELKSLSKTLARANIGDVQEIYKVLVNFINKTDIGHANTTEVIETTQRLSEVFESPVRKSGGQGGELQDRDGTTFNHNDISCEVSPTDAKFHTMSSISSPPLDTSSPKSSGSSIGVQTESHSTGQVSTIPTTLTTVTSCSSEAGVPMGGTMNIPVFTSSPAAGSYNHYGSTHFGTINSVPSMNHDTPSDHPGGTSPLPSKPHGTLSGEGPYTSHPGGFATSPISSKHRGTMPSETAPPVDRNTIQTMTATRAAIPYPNNNSPNISYGRPQTITSVAKSSASSEQRIYLADNQPFSYSDSETVNLPFGTGLQATHHPNLQKHPHPGKDYQIFQSTHPNVRMSEPTAMARYPVHAVSHATGQQYYQYRGTDQVDSRTGHPLSGAGDTIATLSRAVSASSHVLFPRNHALHLPDHANTEAGHAYMGTDHANSAPMPVLGHTFPRTDHAIADPNHAIPIPSHASTRPNHAIADPNLAVPIPSQAFTRTEHANTDSKQPSHAAFRPLQTAHGMPALRQVSSGYSVPGTGGNGFAQTCPTFNAARFAPPDVDPGHSLRTSQPSAPGVHGKPRTMSGGHSDAFQNRHIAKFQEPQPMSAPHTENVFNYQDGGQEEYRVVAEVYNQDGAPIRRQRGWAGPGQKQGEVWNSRTERTSQIQMVIPPVLDFPGVQCVGTSVEADLSIYNPTSRWIRCSSEIVSCTVNGLKVDNQECPFSIRGKTMIGPKLTENIKVDFKCLLSGVYVAEMKVISTPVASISGDIETSSALVSLQGFAEEPKIEIIVDELRTLDFGEIHHRCNRVKPLRIANKGMTVVPLKMRICSSSSPGVFVFSKANTPDAIPELDLQNTTLKCLVPATNELGMKAEPLVIWIELAGKNQHCFEKSDEPEILSAGINIQLDTGTVAKILGNIQLSAVMGFTKIQIPKAFQMAMCLSSPVGKRVSREFPLTNAGNICANVELTIPKHLDVFSVTPDKFQVRPGMAVMVKVTFTPICKESCESVIQVFEPDNSECYEILLRGSAVEPQPEMDDGPPILSNKSWLCWTGVDLGNATHQRLFLLNDSADQSIHFQAAILGEHADFEIQRMRSEFSKGGASSEQMVLRPKERMPIYVLFAPSSFGVFKSALVLKPNRGPRFQIPLYAYGGKSCLSFLELKKTAEGYDAQLGEVSLGRRNILKVTVKNTGQRAAFVKAVCFADFEIRLHYHQTHLSIVPSEFVVPERSSKELVIVYQPLQHDAKACQSDMKRVATVVFYHGDEVLRQWYRRNVTKQQERRRSRTLKFDDIRFDKVFQDENCAAEDFDFPNLENYEQIFDSHISQTFLNLLGGSEKHVVQSAEGVAEESLVVMATPRRRRVEPGTETSSCVKSAKSAEVKEIQEKDDNTVWSLIPEQLSLKVPHLQGSSDSTKKVQLLNFSDRPLEFELIWPAHCIAVTPHTGTIAPKSQTTINISAWGSILNSGVDLPWSGTAYVKCDGIKKAIAIQIHNPLLSDNSPAPSVIDKPLSIIKDNKEEPRLSQTYTAFVKPVKQTQLLKVSPTLVDFSEVEVNKAASSVVTIKNISAASIRWKISSFAPAYAKVSETSSELLRATYPVFSFSTQSGFIRPSQVVKIQVEFRARDGGDYCQIWECQTNPESPLTSTKVKLELSGKAVQVKESLTAVTEKAEDKKNVDRKKVAIAAARESLQEHPSKDSNDPRKSGKTDVYFQSDNVEFPDTEVGKTSTVKIKICNKSSSEQQFRIVTPSAPFYMNCSASLVSKPSYYLKIPVYFSPQESGKHYEATVVFQNKTSGETLTVKLSANSL